MRNELLAELARRELARRTYIESVTDHDGVQDRGETRETVLLMGKDRLIRGFS